MGLYDYLGENQVKVFGVNSVYISEKDRNVLMYGCAGGELRYYKKGQEVPYKTLFYNYGKNFTIIDVMSIIWGREEDEVVHTIRDGKYENSYSFGNIPDNLDFTTVVNKNGTKLKVSSIEDIKAMVKDITAWKEKRDELFLKRHDEMVALRKIINNPDEAEDKRFKAVKEMDAIIKEINNYSTVPMDKWEDETSRIDSNEIGVLLDTLEKNYPDKDDVLRVFKETHKENFDELVRAYMGWFEPDEVHTKEWVYNMLKIS